jgi:DNA polymerase IV
VSDIKKIIHIDMDCFFAAVEILDNPKLKGKPVIVGGVSDRGVVCAASYEARDYGVKSAMPLFQARKLCKNGIYLPVRMNRYKEISKTIHSIFMRYTDLVQPISMDEAFLDVTQNKKNIPYATTIAKEIKKRIKEECGLIASAGVAPNKFLAKIASDMDKPDGFYVIKPKDIEGFMKNLPIKKIWGVGRVTAQKLYDLGIHKASDIHRFPTEYFEEKFGKMGSHLIRLAKGEDKSQVVPYREAKSIGSERTLSENIKEKNELKDFLKGLTKNVVQRIQFKNKCAKGVQIKIKFENFKLITRSELLDDYTDQEEPIYQKAIDLFDKVDFDELGVRLVGISVYQIKSSEINLNLSDYFK